MKKTLMTILAGTVLSSGFALAQDNVSSTSGGSSRRTSSGGFYLEPILSTSRSDSSLKTSQLPIITDDTSGKMESNGLGLKLGAHVGEIFLLGVDGRFSREKFNDSFYSSAEGDSYNYGPTVAVQTPLFGIRLLGTYVMGGEFNPGSGKDGWDLKFRNPRGTRVGAGIYVAAVSINLEYQDLTYDTTDVEAVPVAGGINPEETKVDFINRGYALSLSFPVEL